MQITFIENGNGHLTFPFKNILFIDIYSIGLTCLTLVWFYSFHCVVFLEMGF